MARVSSNASIPYRLYDTGLTLERRQALRGLWARRVDLVEIKPAAQRVQDECFHVATL